MSELLGRQIGRMPISPALAAPAVVQATLGQYCRQANVGSDSSAIRIPCHYLEEE